MSESTLQSTVRRPLDSRVDAKVTLNLNRRVANLDQNTSTANFPEPQPCTEIDIWLTLKFECRGKEFRTDFARVGALREYLPGVPFAACTATASPEKMRKIQTGLSISKDGISVISGTNRPNLFYGVKQIEGSGSGDGDLDFLLPRSTSQDLEIDKIPNAIIYIDHKPSAMGIAAVLRGNLPKALQQRPHGLRFGMPIRDLQRRKL